MGDKVADPPIYQSHRLAEAILLMTMARHERANDVVKACSGVEVCVTGYVPAVTERCDTLTRT